MIEALGQQVVVVVVQVAIPPMVETVALEAGQPEEQPVQLVLPMVH